MWRSGGKAKTHRIDISEACISISLFLSVQQPSDKALQWAKVRLSHTGLRSVQIFDLHAARAGLHDCSCPNHGTDECDCQMVVLLVYGNTDGPSTLILHGSDGKTWFSIVDDTSQGTNAATADSIQNSLKASLLIVE
jgi:hypothetical protein